MDRLPQELLRSIADNVDYTDLEPLRLVNQGLAAAAAPRLFEAIPLWIGVRSLERLTAISEHPQLSRYPKQIIFSPVRFIDYGDDTQYRNKVKDWLEYQPASLSMHTLTMAKHMSAYRSYIEAQRLLSSEYVDVKVLTRAFSQLPRLEILHIDHWDTVIGSEEMIQAFGAFKAADLLSKDCQYTLPTLMKALAASSVKFKVFSLGGDAIEDTSILDNLADYSAAASLARPRAPNSMDHYSYPIGMSSQALSITFCGENLRTCRDALSDVRELHVGEINVERDDPITISRVTAALCSLIDSSTCLETVTLDEITSDFLSDIRPALDIVLPYYPLEKVKKLRLNHYQTTSLSLTNFFRRHGHTIVQVHFDFVSITGGDWSAALVQLRALPLPRLETFVLSYCDEEEADLQVQDFVLKKTEIDPIVARKELLERERQQEYLEQQQQAAALATS